MKIIPAIDILNGKVVRLFKGAYHEKKEYSDDPVSTAQMWQDQGAGYLHVVDLDGAKEGQPQHFDVIERIVKKVSIPIEVGGGIRTLEHIQKYIGLGVDKVVLGSVVMHDISFLDDERLKHLLNRIAISFDALREDDDDELPVMKAGTYGWKEEVPIFDYRGLIDRLVSAGVEHLNYTDRSKDGTLSGFSDKDLSVLASFLDAIKVASLKVIYAGGVGTTEDLKKIAGLRNPKLEGVIVGMALYENRFTLRQAQEIASAV